MVRTQISMTDAQAEGLRRLAALRARSQAALLRDALDELLTADERLRRVERARGVVGRFSSGRHDTADSHDAALDEAFAG
jgi:hypothetical protein